MVLPGVPCDGLGITREDASVERDRGAARGNMKPELKKKTYELVKVKRFDGIKCLECGMVSYHPTDIEKRYCHKCGRYHDG